MTEGCRQLRSVKDSRYEKAPGLRQETRGFSFRLFAYDQDTVASLEAEDQLVDWGSPSVPAAQEPSAP